MVKNPQRTPPAVNMFGPHTLCKSMLFCSSFQILYSTESQFSLDSEALQQKHLITSSHVETFTFSKRQCLAPFHFNEAVCRDTCYSNNDF